jgi:hypothetical protein
MLLLLQSSGSPAPTTKFWLRVGGVWVETTPYIRIGGTWRVATPGINVTGTWR